MTQNEEKTVFITRVKDEINTRELLREVFNKTFQDVLNKFNGKVYNRRFDKALEDGLKSIDGRLFVTSEQKGGDSYSNFSSCNRVEVRISCLYNAGNYSDRAEFWTVVILDGDGRINAENSRKEKYTISWADNFDKTTEEMRQAVKNYDKYIKVAQKISDAIDEFKELPFRFRQNICFNNVFYLNR